METVILGFHLYRDRINVSVPVRFTRLRLATGKGIHLVDVKILGTGAIDLGNILFPLN